MSRTVLIVEDDPALREVLAFALESEGYEVALSCDGLEALDWLGDRRPALIMLDWRLPRMDGPAFARALEERGLRPGVPLLVLSADRQALQRPTRVSAECYVSKPFDLPSLLDEVARLTSSPRRPRTVGPA